MNLFICEKPSVAMEFVKALDMNGNGERHNGYAEDDENIVTWCVGHLIEMSYPEKYDPELKKWELDPLPFIPKTYKYEVIPNVKDQYEVVAGLLNRKDITKIYYSGDSAREGEYIQRLVREKAGHNPNAEEYRVWIDSQTREEILKGIRNAYPLSHYDSLSDSAYARAIEDYLVGINFSRVLSLKYANTISNAAGIDRKPIAVGRVMSCVLGMIVDRERLIRTTSIVPFYGVKADLGNGVTAQWKITDDSAFVKDPNIYKTAGLLEKAPVEDLVQRLSGTGTLTVTGNKERQEQKEAPLLFNLAELQGECTKLFKISPAETLEVAQTLYEAKLTTYPRTDARVLTTAITKEIENNVYGLAELPALAGTISDIKENDRINTFRKHTGKYVDDSKVSDHYALIPTGQGFENLSKMPESVKSVYYLICRRFLSIFYPPAVYNRLTLTLKGEGETFTASFSHLQDAGWMAAAEKTDDDKEAASLEVYNAAKALNGTVPAEFSLTEGKSKAPSRYTTGSMILAMENAGNLIEDPELREQIKGSGIGTSATRAECLKKLEEKCGYIEVNKKNQQIKPSCMGELVYEVLKLSVPNILNPKYTASWETGLQMIVDKKTTKDVYLEKINDYIRKGVASMKETNHSDGIKAALEALKPVYPGIGERQEGVPRNQTDMVCPLCGKPLLINEKKGSLYCSGYKDGCHFGFFTTTCGEKIPDSALHKLVQTTKANDSGIYESGVTSPLTLTSPKKGTKFQAGLKLVFDPNTDKYPKITFVFQDSGNKGKKWKGKK